MKRNQTCKEITINQKRRHAPIFRTETNILMTIYVKTKGSDPNPKKFILGRITLQRHFKNNFRSKTAICSQNFQPVHDPKKPEVKNLMKFMLVYYVKSRIWSREYYSTVRTRTAVVILPPLTTLGLHLPVPALSVRVLPTGQHLSVRREQESVLKRVENDTYINSRATKRLLQVLSSR